MTFSIPYNGELECIKRVIDSNMLQYVSDIYFAGNPLILSSGRRPKIKNFIRQNGEQFYYDDSAFDNDIEQLILLCANKGVESNLLLNASGILDNNQLKYVNSLVEMGVGIITVGSTKILAQIQKYIEGNYRIQNSVYFYQNGKQDPRELVDRGITILLLHPDLNHETKHIARIQEILKDYNNIEYKLMVNEGCLNGCKYRKADIVSVQNYSLDSTINDYINNPEENRVLNQPCRTLMNKYGINETNFIHPKKIFNYEQFNLTYKIVGRSFSTSRILKTVQAYLSGTFSGDLRDIIENFKHSREPVFYSTTQKTQFLLEDPNDYKNEA